MAEYSHRGVSQRWWAGLLLGLAAGPALAATGSDAECERRRSEAAAVALHVAYYPYPAKLRVHLDTSGVRLAGGLGPAEIFVLDPAGRSVLRQRITGTDGPGIVLDLPSLSPGEHRTGVRFSGGSGCEIVGPERRFTHRRFGWERNDLGRSEVVIPPFTALEAAPGRVDAVGRSYRFGESGLWAQIESEGQPMLAEPVRLELRLNGRDVDWVVTRPAAVDLQQETRVEVSSSLRAGDLALQVRQSYEIDGFVKIDLDLSGPGELRIEKLDLVLPLLNRNATLLNAITDLARHHLLGPTPAGSGVVWNSTQVGRDSLPAGFVPYVWLGNEERGLAFAAESTRDWLVSASAPAQEIRRDSDSTDLVVHFATSPARLARERRITFAIQATPAKPRPAGWRTWVLTCDPLAGALRICPMGSGWYWGARTPFGDVYPRDYDTSPLERLAETRRTGRVPLDFLPAWLVRHGVTDRDEQKGYRDSFAFSFLSLAKQPDHAIAYINVHGSAVTPEFLTYVDEWRLVPFGDRTGHDADQRGEIKIRSTPSFHDFMLWHLDKMLASKAFDGFFFDNTYLAASYDEVVGPAYRDDAGNLVPGVDLFALRDFFRRAQTLVYQHRRRWLNLVHMTTTPIAPLHGWSGISLDGEWKYGLDDYPERFPPSFLRAASLGSQTGSVPAYLHGLDASASGAQRARLERQLAGLMAAHEIRVLKRIDGPLKTIWSALLAAGYGREGCAVRRYWDTDPDFTLEGVDASTLLVACDGAALALVASVGQAGTARLRIDSDALGLGSVAECADPERRGRVDLLAPDGCVFPLDRYDVRLIRLRGDAR